MSKLCTFKQCQTYLKYLKSKGYPITGWDYICQSFKLPPSFVRKHIDEIDWRMFSVKQKMNGKFLREFKDYIKWETIQFEHLSEDELREFGLTEEVIKEIKFNRFDL